MQDKPELKCNKERGKLWSTVLQGNLNIDPAYNLNQRPVKLILVHLVMQGQSAHCESALSLRSHIRRSLNGQEDAKLWNSYSVVQLNIQEGVHGGPA